MRIIQDKAWSLFLDPRIEQAICRLVGANRTLTLSTRMPYWTSWPDNTDAVAVQLDKMIINA